MFRKSNYQKTGRENWVPDEETSECSICSAQFGFWTRRHHCRACGNIVCGRCGSRRLTYTPTTRTSDERYKEKMKRVCDDCYTKISAERERQAKISQALDCEDPGALLNQLPGEGAYLVFQPHMQHGSMFIVWSKEKIEDALAYGHPKKQVPAHKFARGGKTEILRNISNNKTSYFAGWCQFVQACSRFRCTIVDYGRTDSKTLIPVTLYLRHKDHNRVERIMPNTPFTTDGVDIVTAMHSDRSDLDCQSLERTLFADKSEKAGKYIALDVVKYQTN